MNKVILRTKGFIDSIPPEKQDKIMSIAISKINPQTNWMRREKMRYKITFHATYSIVADNKNSAIEKAKDRLRGDIAFYYTHFDPTDAFNMEIKEIKNEQKAMCRVCT